MADESIPSFSFEGWLDASSKSSSTTSPIASSSYSIGSSREQMLIYILSKLNESKV